MVARHGLFIDPVAFHAFAKGEHVSHSNGLTAKLIGFVEENPKGLPSHFPMFARYPLWDTEFTGLHLAAINGQLGAVEWLLANGADANKATTHGVLPLSCALASRSTAILTALIAAGARVPTEATKVLLAEHEMQRYETATLIQWALNRGHAGDLEILLDAAPAAAWAKDVELGKAVRGGFCRAAAVALTRGVARGDVDVAAGEDDAATMAMKPHHRKRRGRFPSIAPPLTVASALGALVLRASSTPPSPLSPLSLPSTPGL